MIKKKNITKVLFLFLSFHFILWTLIPSISNENLPLDTIEALAWGSNLDWGFNKHPPLSAFAAEVFYSIFGSNDWAYYILSQVFVVIAFIYVWKLSNEIFEDKIHSLISVLVLTSIYFYNYTTPEFNVNVSQLPFWALTVYFFWKSINSNSKTNWVLFGIFSALGFLSKYLFIYLLAAIFLYFILNIKKNKKFILNYFLSLSISLLILLPHFIWLYENNFVTIFYGLSRSALTDYALINHFKNPIILLIKQILILVPFFNRDDMYPYRAGVYLLSGLSTLIPISHIMFYVESHHLREFYLSAWVCGGLFYIIGACIYVKRFPENCCPC